jgi:hypothetical protein
MAVRPAATERGRVAGAMAGQMADWVRSVGRTRAGADGSHPPRPAVHLATAGRLLDRTGSADTLPVARRPCDHRPIPEWDRVGGRAQVLTTGASGGARADSSPPAGRRPARRGDRSPGGARPAVRADATLADLTRADEARLDAYRGDEFQVGADRLAELRQGGRRAAVRHRRA